MACAEGGLAVGPGSVLCAVCVCARVHSSPCCVSVVDGISAGLSVNGGALAPFGSVAAST